jgi:hypothetical protein
MILTVASFLVGFFNNLVVGVSPYLNNNSTLPLLSLLSNPGVNITTIDSSVGQYITKSLSRGNKFVIYQRSDYRGIGSFMLCFFQFALFFRDVHGRKEIILDDRVAHDYRVSDSEGIAVSF